MSDVMPDFVLVFETYPAVFYTFITILGLVVGSFLNVVIYRLPIMMENSWKQEFDDYFNDEDTSTVPQSKEQPVFNLAKPDSTCPHCGHKITPWENIPIISWLILRGKCSNCKSPISIRYPAIEALTGIMSFLVAWQFGINIETLYLLVFVWSLIALTFIDIDKMLLPDQITLPLMWLGLILSTQNTFVDTNSAIWGAALGYLSLWSVYWAFKLLTGKEGMGFGDFKLLAALGAWLGVKSLPLIVILSSLVGAVIGIIQIVLQKHDQRQPIPFGPYLAIAGIIALFFGDEIIQAYIQYIL